MSNTKIFKLEIDESKELENEKKREKIISSIKRAHQTLYDAEHLTGEEAVEDILTLLFLHSIYPILTDKKEEGKIDMFNVENYKNKRQYFDNKNKEWYDKIFSCFNLQTLSNIEHLLIRNNKNKDDSIKAIGRILGTHPATEQIFNFEDYNILNFKKATTYIELYKKFIKDIDIKDIYHSSDLIGCVYEYFMTNYAKSNNSLGQFFTPRKMMNITLNYIEKKYLNSIFDEYDSVDVADYCMGTAGWLSLLYSFKDEKYSKKIVLHGSKLKTSTAKYAFMNILLTTGKPPEHFKCWDSLENVESDKVSVILTNPPFGSDLSYEDMKKNYDTVMNKKIPNVNTVKFHHIYKLAGVKGKGKIKGVLWFLDLCIYKLYNDGICIIVIPYGDLFSGKPNKKIREKLMDLVDILEIIKFPAGTFDNTAVLTSVMIFRKKAKHSKKNDNEKEHKHHHRYIKYSYSNIKCTEIKKIANVKYSTILKDKNVALNVENYVQDDTFEKEMKEKNKIELDEFGNVFELKKGKLQSSKTENISDELGKFITLSNDENKWKNIPENKCDLYGDNVFISIVKPLGKIIFCDKLCTYSNLMSRLIIKKDYKGKINIKFWYYYLRSISKLIEEKYQKGIANKSLDIDLFNKMKIPIPSIEMQNQIANYSTTYDNLIKSSNELVEIYENINLLVEIRKEMENTNNKIYTLGELIEVNGGKDIEIKNDDPNGKYPLYGGGGISSYVHEFNREGITCKISRDGITEYNCVQIICGKYYLNKHGMTVISKDENIILDKYLWYTLLSIKNKIYSIATGLAQKGIDTNNLKKLEIKVPSIEIQKKIIDNCDKISKDIKNLKHNIKKYKKEQSELIKSY